MKAIIMSHERGGSYVMDREGCFRFLKGYTGRPVGAEIEFQTQPSAQLHSFGAIAACFVLFVFLGSFTWLWNSESYSVYVDINPSVQLVFNDLGRLKASKPLNEDGGELLEGVSLQGSPGDMVVSLIKAAEQKNFFVPQGNSPAVAVTVSGRSDENSEKNSRVIQGVLEENGMGEDTLVDTCTADFSARAEEMGVSPGKLKLAERLQAYSPSASVKELAEAPVAELTAAIREAEETGALPQPDGENDEDNEEAGLGGGVPDPGDGGPAPAASGGQGSEDPDEPEDPHEGSVGAYGDTDTAPGMNPESPEEPEAGSEEQESGMPVSPQEGSAGHEEHTAPGMSTENPEIPEGGSAEQGGGDGEARRGDQDGSAGEGSQGGRIGPDGEEDPFESRRTSHNALASAIDGIELAQDAEDSWRIRVTSPDLQGEIDIAYKMGDEYHIATLEIGGEGEYRIGDGCGREGVDPVKIGGERPLSMEAQPPGGDGDGGGPEVAPPPVENLGFIGYELDEGKVVSASVYWVELTGDDPKPDMDAVQAAFRAWVELGGLERKFEGWETDDFSSIMLEEAYSLAGFWFFIPGYILADHDHGVPLRLGPPPGGSENGNGQGNDNQGGASGGGDTGNGSAIVNGVAINGFGSSGDANSGGANNGGTNNGGANSGSGDAHSGGGNSGGGGSNSGGVNSGNGGANGNGANNGGTNNGGTNSGGSNNGGVNSGSGGTNGNGANSGGSNSGGGGANGNGANNGGSNSGGGQVEAKSGSSDTGDLP